MKFKHIFLFPMIFLIFAMSCNAQKTNFKYSTKSAKAIKSYENAAVYYDSYNNTDALKELDNAIKADEKFIEAYMLKGDIYTDLKKYELAITNYKKAIEIDPDFFSNNYLTLAIAELSIGKYQDTKNDLEIYIKFKNINIINKKRAEYMLKLADFGINAIKNPVPFKPVNIGKGVNTTAKEYYPEITVDDKTLLFTRLVCDSLSPNKCQEDFFVSEKDSSVWGNSYDIGPPINTLLNEGAPAFSPDGKYIIFTACEKFGEYGFDRTGFGSCDLFYTKKVGKTWSKPFNIGRPVNSENFETQPSISSDGKTLYFIRGIKIKNGNGNMDIYSSTLNNDGTWGEAVKLNDKINTSLREESVFIHPDNQTLYFSSEGHLGMGGFDLYVSKRDSTGDWGEPVNLGYPINTYGDETSLFVDAMGDLAYFSSDRAGGYGNLDIYSFELYDKIRPNAVTYMKGIVYNSITKAKLEAKFELIDLKTSKVVLESKSDAVTGEFLVCLPTEKDYALHILKDGYLFYSENFTLTGAHSNADPFMKNIPLQPIKVGETVVLKNVFFDTDKFDLKTESYTELEKLIDLLKKNPEMKIEISGHTDNVGDAEYNQTLSENRAKAVCEYLTAKGIAKERLTFKGYGITKPIDKNDTEAGRANNRRTEFKVVS
ncbi:MAG: OmpA family protein [Bacteroidetes bacterium]|nr:OmpA family protein [Bacteroidota bacterium]